MASQGESTTTATTTRPRIQCHYEVLGVDQVADAATIKKAHRKLALKYHPDKNIGDDSAAETFRLVQQAYECLSDAAERKWYDDHRDAILKGWSAGGGGSGGDGDDDHDMLFNIVPFMFSGCYRGFGDDDQGFYAVYKEVFHNIYAEEERGAKEMSSVSHLAADFGNSQSAWADVATFYQAWETFSSSLNFSWADPFDALKDAPNRRVRRAMEDENRKARKAAKRARNDEILTLVRFVKKRDIRVQQQKEKAERERLQKAQQQKLDLEQRKKDTQTARESWRVQAEQEMAVAEEQDRLAGRLRLADLEDEDYDYGGKKGKKGKKKKSKQKKPNKKKDDSDGDSNDEKVKASSAIGTEGDGDEAGNNGEGPSSTAAEDDAENDDAAADDDDRLAASDMDDVEQSPPAALVDEHEIQEESSESEESESSEEEDEPDYWHCECCRKDFKSEGQMQNHMKSKKHKEAYKRYQKKLAELVEKEMADSDSS